jgi:hypothetical protein
MRVLRFSMRGEDTFERTNEKGHMLIYQYICKRKKLLRIVMASVICAHFRPLSRNVGMHLLALLNNTHANILLSALECQVACTDSYGEVIINL